MRIMLVGEGPHDIGEARSWDARKQSYVTLPGWLQPIVSAATGSVVSFEAMRRVSLQIQPRDPLRSGLPPGHVAKAYLAKRRAVQENFDLLIFMADADSPNVADWRRIVAEIEDGFSRAEGATRCIACVPMSVSESWLLADPSAWEAVCGSTVECLPLKPESSWGHRNDPAGNHPKRFFARICDVAGVSDNRATRVSIAEALDLSIARRRCSQSMDPFISQIEG